MSHVKEMEIPFSEYFSMCFRLKGDRSRWFEGRDGGEGFVFSAMPFQFQSVY